MLGHLADPFLGPDFDPKNGTAKCRKKEPAFRCSSAECGAKSCGLCPNKPHGDFGTLPFDKIWPLSLYELLLQALHVPIWMCASEKASCRRFCDPSFWSTRFPAAHECALLLQAELRSRGDTAARCATINCAAPVTRHEGRVIPEESHVAATRYDRLLSCVWNHKQFQKWLPPCAKGHARRTCCTWQHCFRPVRAVINATFRCMACYVWKLTPASQITWCPVQNNMEFHIEGLQWGGQVW